VLLGLNPKAPGFLGFGQGKIFLCLKRPRAFLPVKNSVRISGRTRTFFKPNLPGDLPPERAGDPNGFLKPGPNRPEVEKWFSLSGLTLPVPGPSGWTVKSKSRTPPGIYIPTTDFNLPAAGTCLHLEARPSIVVNCGQSRR